MEFNEMDRDYKIEEIDDDNMSPCLSLIHI